jgi:hypothetical protein
VKIGEPDECWEWLGFKQRKGYGTFAIKRGNYPAHRVSFTINKGSIPGGLTLDHLCCNKGCVNPRHLEPVTNTENIARSYSRSTTCKNGHPKEEHSYFAPNGHRRCRICDRAKIPRKVSDRRERKRRQRELQSK